MEYKLRIVYRCGCTVYFDMERASDSNEDKCKKHNEYSKTVQVVAPVYLTAVEIQTLKGLLKTYQ